LSTLRLLLSTHKKHFILSKLGTMMESTRLLCLFLSLGILLWSGIEATAIDSKSSVVEKQQEYDLAATSSRQEASSADILQQQDSLLDESSRFLRFRNQDTTHHQRPRLLEGGDYDFDFSNISELEAAEVGAVVALLLVALLLVLCCCCCCRRGCSLWDLVAMCCLWELCCGNNGMGDTMSDFQMM
jgi:hypothetical protein